MTVNNAVAEMKKYATTLADPDTITKALTKAYGLGDYSHVGPMTRLLGMVWPYMKTMPESTCRDWLQLAVDEAASAYGVGRGLSCAMGIQERLAVTGFLEMLNEPTAPKQPTDVGGAAAPPKEPILVDPRLIAISTLVQNIAAGDASKMVEGGVPHLPAIIETEILTDRAPNEATIERWMRASAKAYADSIPAFNSPALPASGMHPSTDCVLR